tara:strand:- start:2905 stop:4119 length:1215 start_codon:yes stop_codon:yes gene_type:complete
MKGKFKKIILAYSGGLDTTVILHWLKKTYSAEVIAFTADLGQKIDTHKVEEKAIRIGAANIHIEDLKNEFVKNYIFPMFRCNTVYEGEYLLGTSIARPLIAKRIVEIANDSGAHAISHGATGKGNDQIRFELSAYSLSPNIQVIAPWRIWDFNSRSDLVNYCKQEEIEVDKKSENDPLYSMDENILHTSYEGGPLEDTNTIPPEDMWLRTQNLMNTPNEPSLIKIGFKNGDPISIDDSKLEPGDLLQKLNELAGKHGIGRLDLVEHRFTGMKSRGCYETPGGTILLKAHRAIESITLDGEVIHLKDELMPKYSNLIYNGLWWSPERIALQAFIDKTQEYVEGSVSLKLFKGNIEVLGRESNFSLYDPKVATFEDDADTFNQEDASGFIKINAVRLKATAKRKKD